MNFNKIYQLECGVQHYAWGVRRSNDRIPFIAELLGMDAPEGVPFAELWIGAHPKCPSQVLLDEVSDGKISLDQLITGNPVDILGARIVNAGYRELPFLLKILDSAQALSIQAHPDLQLAASLHKCDPEHYPDANHKPEIAISLTGLDAMCQFRNVADIRADVSRLEPLRRFFAKFANLDHGDEWLRECYALLFRTEANQVATVIAEVLALPEVVAANTLQDRWAMRLNELYPGDRGVLCAYFLNIVHLDPGEAVFLAANQPHSYLQGTIVECMASSDNVVRAGLTPKFIDTDTLLDMLTYDTGEPYVQTGSVEQNDAGIRVYRGEVPEFQVDIVELNPDESKSIRSDGTVSLMLIIEGVVEFCSEEFAKFANRGSVWLWPAALSELTIQAGAKGVRIVRARPNF
jgi:mannose-6-phosphate isomerase